ncbi:type IV secretion system DNA-binding domain-containing protein [Haloarcula amylovorans]|uniref:type IV secretion system DNA-binding domain-containing protein n=1 Tax=Haloarcula amylovorans TaxID=2562280 RepID=UPI001ADDB184|nr:type IV secretion system DNA-binding domain-containing protein [Halomicroarcula amylolytica]
MGLLDRFASTTDTETSGYETTQIDADLAEALTTPGDRDAISVRPHTDNGGIEAMDSVLESLHSVETSSGLLRGGDENISPAHSFEVRYTRPNDGGDRVLSLRYVAGDDRTNGPLERQLTSQYPDSQLSRTSSELLSGSGVEGRHIAGARLHLRRYTLYPIKNVDLPGFTTDPMGSILEEMVGQQAEDATDADVVVQIQFKPAQRDWTDGIENGHGVLDASDERVRGDPSIKSLAMNLREPTFEKQWRVFTRETIEYPPSKVEKQVAKLLEEQQGEKGWRLCLRVFAISDDPDVAVSRASSTAGMFRNFYENNAEQTFVPDPLDGRELCDVVEKATHREWTDHGIVKAQREVSGLLNVPEADHVATNKLRWSMSRPGEGIPPRTPRFDFQTHGVAGASDDAQQVTMLDESGEGDPYWYGFGSRHGVEAGVTPETLETHQFVGGGTGKGKTTWLVNFASQVMQRGHGALIFDPKGKDADEFVREWPDDRDREDFVFVDLTDEFDKQVRFNFLEVPSDAEPDSRQFASTIEALCDDLASMVALAGGQDNYWGARMDRVVRTFIRGMAKSGKTCTLLDLAALCTAEENRERFTEWMDRERLQFIKRTAERIEGFDDADLEPLAGRLDQWIQNDAIRDLIAARESTVSIRDVVREGKVVVVRNAPSSGETEKRLFATALIRRAWVAAREADEDRPPFYVVCDEFDSIVSEKSDIASILSEARAFDFSLTLSCQNPSNQLPERVQKAIENQCETFISFNPGGRDDARLIAGQHSRDVEKDDLTNLSKYRFYMRTHDADDELTHSYKVDAFPPVGETRERVSGEAGLSDDALDELKRESVERYGKRAESPAEQRRASHFYAEGDDVEAGPGTGPDHGGPDARAGRERAVLKAVFDESIHADGIETGGFIPKGDVEARIRDYLDADGDGIADVWDIVERVPEDLLARDHRDGETHLQATERGQTEVFASGDDEKAGGLKHRQLLRDSYEPLARLGLCVDIVQQDDDDLPDARATPEPMRGVDVEALSLAETREVAQGFAEDYPTLDRLTGGETAAVETESETSEKPGQTIKNLAKAHQSGEKCLLVARPDDARRVEGALSDPPFVRDVGDDGTQTFYNRRDLWVDGDRMLRPEGAEQTVWRFDPGREAYILSDSDGRELATFDDHEAVFKDAEAYPATEGDVDDPDEWRRVRKPVIPERVFDGETPDPDDWRLVVLGAEDVPTDLALRADGELTPLGETDETTTGSEGEETTDDADPLDDVAERPAALYDLLVDHGDSVETSEAHTLAQEADDGPDVARRTIGNYLDDLADAGVLDVDRNPGEANVYHLAER